MPTGVTPDTAQATASDGSILSRVRTMALSRSVSAQPAATRGPKRRSARNSQLPDLANKVPSNAPQVMALAPESVTNSACETGQLVVMEPPSAANQDLESVPAISETSYKSMPLSDLGPTIAKLHEGAEQCSASVRKVVENALAFVLEAGKALQAAKERVPHGQWGSWLLQHVPALSHDRANRYMKAAREIPHVRNLDKIKTVRQLYVCTGVLKEPAKGGRKKAVAPVLDRDTALAPADFVSRFRALRLFLENAKPRLLAREMPLAEVTEMAGEVEAILALFRDLQGHLEKPLVNLPPTSTPPSLPTARPSPPAK